MGSERSRAALTGAAALAALWLAALAAYGVGLLGAAPDGAPRGLTLALTLIAAATPAAAAALGHALLRRLDALAAETAALREALGAMGADTGVGLSPAAARAATEAARAAAAETARALTARLDRFETALGTMARRESGAAGSVAGTEAEPARTTGGRQPQPANEPGLPFAEAAEPAAAPLSWAEIVRALDFPRDENDAAGFAAMRAALRDAEIAQALQAAEDVLTILATDALHMEDLRPEPTAPAAWRAYAEGARGKSADAVGAVRDPQAVGRVLERLRRDAVFRDACLVLARRWGLLMARAARELGEDAILSRLADTRSGRAFMLTARAMGAFG